MGNLFSNHGRDTRLSWWIRQIAVMVAPWLALVAFYLIALTGQGAVANAVAGAFAWLLILGGSAIYLLLLWISIMSSVRRLHDMNLSGWWCLAYFVAAMAFGFWSETWSGAVMLIMMIHLGFFPGTSGPNRFGVPKKRDSSIPAMRPKAA